MYQLTIPTFNNLTFLKSFIEQKAFDSFSSLEIYDNNSSFSPMIQLLQEFEKGIKIKPHRLLSDLNSKTCISTRCLRSFIKLIKGGKRYE